MYRSFIVAMVTMNGECLAKNMIQEANFLKFFSDSSQIDVKLGRNMQWVEILRKLKKN